MKDMTFFTQEPTTGVNIEMLIEQVVVRATNMCIEVDPGYNLEAISDWLRGEEAEATRPYPLFAENGFLTEGGCRVAVQYLPEELLAILNNDITIFYHGIASTHQMSNSVIAMSHMETLEGTKFGGIDFLPPGVEKPFYFPNGARGVSSTYLHKVNQELGKSRNHKTILEKIRKYFSEIETGRNFCPSTDYAFFALDKGEYKGGNGEMRAHLWMSEDLCMAIAGTEHPVIQRRIISDLNCMTNLVQQYVHKPVPRATFAGLLPNTGASNLRNERMVELLAAESTERYAISRVRRMWCEQTGGDEATFDNKYISRPTYQDLHAICNELEIAPVMSPSPTGGMVTMFPLVALEVCFRGVDLTSLRVPT